MNGKCLVVMTMKDQRLRQCKKKKKKNYGDFFVPQFLLFALFFGSVILQERAAPCASVQVSVFRPHMAPLLHTTCQKILSISLDGMSRLSANIQTIQKAPPPHPPTPTSRYQLLSIYSSSSLLPFTDSYHFFFRITLLLMFAV